MRLRQIVIAARSLDSTIEKINTVFGLDVPFRDPGVAEFGLVNGVLAVGDTFLEVVTPVSEDAPARRFLERRGSNGEGGDGAYMVIIQTDDLASDRRRLEALRARIVWSVDLPDISTIHLHPRDVGGAILSLDEARPAESWRWGGPDWERKTRSDRVSEVVAVDFGSPEPEALATRWSKILDRPCRRVNGSGRFAIALDRGTLRFAPAAKEGVLGYGLAALDPAAIRTSAAKLRLETVGDAIVIAGTRFTLE
jgi:hypothetical protein